MRKSWHVRRIKNRTTILMLLSNLLKWVKKPISVFLVPLSMMRILVRARISLHLEPYTEQECIKLATCLPRLNGMRLIGMQQSMQLIISLPQTRS